MCKCSSLLELVAMSLRTFLLLGLSYTVTCEGITENSLKLLEKVYNQCVSKPEILKCFKIQGLKVMDRALHSKALNIWDGVTLVVDGRQARKLASPPLNESKLEKLSSQEIDGLMVDTTKGFLDSHKLEISIPKLLEEGRGKGGGGGGYGGGGGGGGKKKMGAGALLWVLAIKGTFMAMAYKGIAVMSGTAIIVGKIALILSFILGLKKLINSGQEKTTVEIIKVPKISESHTHSTSYEDEGHHRSYILGENFGKRTGFKPSTQVVPAW